MAGMIALLEKAAKGKTTAVVDALTEAVGEIDEAKKHAEEVVAHRIVAKMGEMVPTSDESLGGMSVEAVFKQALESALFKPPRGGLSLGHLRQAWRGEAQGDREGSFRECRRKQRREEDGRAREEREEREENEKQQGQQGC